MIYGYTISIIIMVLFWSYVLMSFYVSGNNSIIRSLKKNEIVSTIIILFFSTIAVCYIIKKNNFIYYWDYGREWTTAIRVSTSLLENPVRAMKDVYDSINTTDYNQFMPLLIVFPLNILGKSFARYVVINQIMYMCPAIFLMGILAKKILQKCNLKVYSLGIYIAFFATTPILYYVLLDGFMDPPILILITIILLLSVDWDFQSFDIRRCICISIGLLLLVLFRRHFAYWVVGYICSCLVVAIFKITEDKKNIRLTIRNYLLSMIFIGFFCLAVLGGFFGEFLYRSVFNNFSYAYDAYDVAWSDKFSRVVIVFGIINLLMILASLVFSIAKKNDRKIVLGYFCNIVIATFLLWRVLQMNWHQYYIIVIQMMILAIIGFSYLIQLFPKKYDNLMLWGYIICGVFGLANCFCGTLHDIKALYLFPTCKYEPKVRYDMNEISDMVDYLNEISGPDKWVYVLAGTNDFNSETIEKSRLPYEIKAVPYQYMTKTIDLRDGFPIEMFNAGIVVVGDPIQANEESNAENVVSYFAKEMLDENSYISRHYELTKSFELQNGITAKVYVKTSNYTKEDYVKLQKYFDQLYPDYPELFHDLIVYPDAYFPDELNEKLVIKDKDRIFSTQTSNSTEKLVSEKEGYLIYGPYKRIEKGKYRIQIDYEYKDSADFSEGEALGVVSFCLDMRVIASSDYYVGNDSVIIDNIVVDDSSDNCEIQMYCNTPGVQFKKFEIIKVGTVE